MTQYRSMGIAAAEYGDSVNEIDAEAHFFSPSSVNYPTACATTFQKVVGIVLLCATCVFVGGAMVSPASPAVSPTPSSASVASVASLSQTQGNACLSLDSSSINSFEFDYYGVAYGSCTGPCGSWGSTGSCESPEPFLYDGTWLSVTVNPTPTATSSNSCNWGSWPTCSWTATATYDLISRTSAGYNGAKPAAAPAFSFGGAPSTAAPAAVAPPGVSFGEPVVSPTSPAVSPTPSSASFTSLTATPPPPGPP